MFQFARTSAKAVVVAASAAGFIAFGTGFAGADVLGDTVAPGTVPSLKFGLAGHTPDLSQAVSAPKTDNLTTSHGDMSGVGPQSQAKVDEVQGTLDKVTNTVGLSDEVEHQRSGPDIHGALDSGVDKKLPSKPGGTHETLHNTVNQLHGATNAVHSLDAQGLTQKAKGLADVDGLAGAKSPLAADGLPVAGKVGGNLPVVGGVTKPSQGTNGAVQQNISHQRAVDHGSPRSAHPLGDDPSAAPPAPTASDMPDLPLPLFAVLTPLKQIAGGASQQPAVRPTSHQVDVDSDLPTDQVTKQVPTDQAPADQVPTEQLPTEGLPTDGLPTDGLPMDQLPTSQLTSQLPTDQLPLGLKELLAPETPEVSTPAQAETLPADVTAESANNETETAEPSEAADPIKAKNLPADVDVNEKAKRNQKAPLLDLTNAGLVGDLAGNAGLQDTLAM
ncbi:hypothetical protein [Nocardiopsis rhodophaea]|uniref:hypothetical protein n=1 Tax=Nocardiopsis rhodophaea TaxID=280238 RepID=UPI0031D10467